MGDDLGLGVVPAIFRLRPAQRYARPDHSRERADHRRPRTPSDHLSGRAGSDRAYPFGSFGCRDIRARATQPAEELGRQRVEGIEVQKEVLVTK